MTSRRVQAKEDTYHDRESVLEQIDKLFEEGREEYVKTGKLPDSISYQIMALLARVMRSMNRGTR